MQHKTFIFYDIQPLANKELPNVSLNGECYCEKVSKLVPIEAMLGWSGVSAFLKEEGNVEHWKFGGKIISCLKD